MESSDKQRRIGKLLKVLMAQAGESLTGQCGAVFRKFDAKRPEPGGVARFNVTIDVPVEFLMEINVQVADQGRRSRVKSKTKSTARKRK